jgi:hypothetical protein
MNFKPVTACCSAHRGSGVQKKERPRSGWQGIDSGTYRPNWLHPSVSPVTTAGSECECALA